MPHVAPTPDQTLCFYRAALATARLLDHDGDTRVLDSDADAAWQVYGGEFPPAVRCDLVLRNFAMLYPAAFAPGPVFGLSGWYDDAPWGTGFERPALPLVEKLFVHRDIPESVGDALEVSLRAWGLGADTDDAVHTLTAKISPQTIVLVSAGRASAACARAFLRNDRLSIRSQFILVSGDPASRHALGITCALLHQAGLPLLVDVRRDDAESLESWANREKRRLGLTRADLVVLSPDAPGREQEATKALAAALGATETIVLAAS